MFVQGIYLSFDRRSAYFNFTEREMEAQNYAKDPEHLEPLDPVLIFNTDEKDTKTAILAELEKAGKEFATKYILNNGGEKEWNEWLKTAERLKYKELEKIYNAAQKRYNEL